MICFLTRTIGFSTHFESEGLSGCFRAGCLGLSE